MAKPRKRRKVKRVVVAFRARSKVCSSIGWERRSIVFGCWVVCGVCSARAVLHEVADEVGLTRLCYCQGILLEARCLGS